MLLFESSVLSNIMLSLSLNVIIKGIEDFIARAIDNCSNDNCPFHLHSLIVLENAVCDNVSMSSMNSECSGNSSSSKSSLCNYFKYHRVTRMIVIERPKDHVQLYVAEGMAKNQHFSCQTSFVPFLYCLMKEKNSDDLEIMFIPRFCQKYQSKSLHVFNDISQNQLSSLQLDENTLGNLTKVGNGHGNKRNESAISIGLQTMYSHQQHTSRYTMLPHSRPHMTTVKNHSLAVRKNLLDAYKFICDYLNSVHAWQNEHPFNSYNGTVMFDESWYTRLNLRQELLNRFFLDDLSAETYGIGLNIMFESCTLQQTGTLRFHRDSMNCPLMDHTVALHVPHQNNGDVCTSFLYYSRKCVGDYAIRMGSIHSFIKSDHGCKLSKLCLKALLETNTIFDYQGTLFENDLSLNELAQSFERMDSGYSCPDVADFTGLRCFKHGAAFDKMGYYSIFVNVFFSLHYMGIATDIDDSISLSIYFGLLCNGTSNLAAAWKSVKDNIEFVMQWCEENNDCTRLFHLMIHLEEQRRQKDKKRKDKTTFGCCKLHRYQYANYAEYVIAEADMIHCYVKDFLTHMKQNDSNLSKKKNQIGLQMELFNSVSHIKGIGPLSFNQFWHALCLCGVLPLRNMQCSIIAPKAGPSQIIQTFDSTCTKPESCLRKMHEVKGKLSSFGMNKITDFLLENMLCELHRLGNKSQIIKKTMNAEQKVNAFLSNEFDEILVNSVPTQHPDIYYTSPFTECYQHIFRVCKDELVMRLSFLKNSNTSSCTLRCIISHHDDD